MYRWFEQQAGEGDTIIVGDFNDEKITDFASLEALGDGDVLPVKGTTIGRHGPDHDYDHMFFPGLRSRVESADVDTWTTDYSGRPLDPWAIVPGYARVNVAP